MAVNIKLHDLECPICRSLLRDPFVTTCGHTFCHQCLSLHQSTKSTCPTCSSYLSQDHVYPNLLLGQLVRAAAASEKLASAPLIEQLCWAVQDDPTSVAPEDLDKLIMALQQKQRAMRHKHATANMQLLLNFLQQSRQRSKGKLQELQAEIGLLEADMAHIQPGNGLQNAEEQGRVGLATHNSLVADLQLRLQELPEPAQPASQPQAGTPFASPANQEPPFPATDHRRTSPPEGVITPNPSAQPHVMPCQASALEQPFSRGPQGNWPDEEHEPPPTNGHSRPRGHMPAGMSRAPSSPDDSLSTAPSWEAGSLPANGAGESSQGSTRRASGQGSVRLGQAAQAAARAVQHEAAAGSTAPNLPPPRAQSPARTAWGQTSTPGLAAETRGIRAPSQPVLPADARGLAAQAGHAGHAALQRQQGPQDVGQQRQTGAVPAAAGRAAAGVAPQGGEGPVARAGESIHREHKRRVHQYLDLERLYLQLRRHPDSAQQAPAPAQQPQTQSLGKRKAPEPYEPAAAAAADPAEAGAGVGSGEGPHRPQQHAAQREAGEGGHLERFQRMLTISTRCSTLKVVAEVPPVTAHSTASLLSSLEFDCQARLLATAGVSKRIAIYNYEDVVQRQVRQPASELVTRSKLSCLAWSAQEQSQLIASDYEGIVTLWDAAGGTPLTEWEAHDKRIWSVDFSHLQPQTFVSGSDDGTVKVWDAKMPDSVGQLDLRANVCSVQLSRHRDYQLAVGCADHLVHLYDLRNLSKPLHAFSGHRKAVSYVRFKGPDHVVSASTDSTLRLWSMTGQGATQASEAVFDGHLNDKNFVGLATEGDFLACGSETNEVFVYHHELTKPIAVHNFGWQPTPRPHQESVQFFISAVAWRPRSQDLLAANSQGVIQVLQLPEASGPQR